MLVAEPGTNMDEKKHLTICKVPYRRYKISRNEIHFSHVRRADNGIFIFAMQNSDLHIVTDIKAKLSSKERHGFEHCLKL